MGPSIQEELEKAVFKITQERIQPEAASRTDRGVHAEGQVVHLPSRKYAPQQLLRAMNGLLPPDIRVLKTEPAALSFHPTLDAKGKEYHYRLCLGAVQAPMYRFYSWHFHYPLNIGKMDQAAKDLLGFHNFSSFANERADNPFCTLDTIQITPILENRLQITIIGNRFLYKMARNIVGTLLYIGCGKLSSDCIPSLFKAKDRKKTGMTAPAHGLFLHKVFYEELQNDQQIHF